MLMLKYVDVDVAGEVQQINWSLRMIEEKAHSCWIKLVFFECLLQIIELDANEVLEDVERFPASWFRIGVMRDLLIFEFSENFDFVIKNEAIDSGSGVCFAVTEDFHPWLVDELEINENPIDDLVVGISQNRLGLSCDARAFLLLILLLLLDVIVVQT